MTDTKNARDYVARVDADVLLTGDKLRDGMVVLVESKGMRAMGDAWDQWATIRNVASVTPRYTLVDNGWRQELPFPTQVRFIAEFADGTMRPRSCFVERYWIVKRASITPPTCPDSPPDPCAAGE